ncbi:hypothetical protein AKJ16_DCAP02702 [Drosera capensis]
MPTIGEYLRSCLFGGKIEENENHGFLSLVCQGCDSPRMMSKSKQPTKIHAEVNVFSERGFMIVPGYHSFTIANGVKFSCRAENQETLVRSEQMTVAAFDAIILE